MTNQEYQKKEMADFLNQKSAYFYTVSEFAESLEGMDLDEQIQWIENGSYGAGACLVMQQVFYGLNNRMNKTARIGRVVLHAFYGAPFTGYNKLPLELRDKLDRAVNRWINGKHEFAMNLEV